MLFYPSTVDRERYDLPESVHFDGRRFSNKEADLLLAQCPDPDDPAVTIGPERWMEILSGEILENPDGSPILREDDGEPRRGFKPPALGRMFWLAVRRTGVDVAWEDFEYDLWGTRIRPDKRGEDGGEDGAAGKEPGSSPT